MRRDDLGRETFVERAWEWSRTYGGEIDAQFQRLGFGPDWQRSRFTMDDGLSAAVRRVFVQLYRDGLIYRGTRLVNWDPTAQTTVSDAELELRRARRHALAHSLSVRQRRSQRGHRDRDDAPGNDARRRRRSPSIPTDRRYAALDRPHRLAAAALRSRDSDHRRRSRRPRVRNRRRKGHAGPRSGRLRDRRAPLLPMPSVIGLDARITGAERRRRTL